MPVTKTAKRALRSSERKNSVNKSIVSKLEIATRMAQKSRNSKDVVRAISLVDRARKKHIIHKNKAARMKSSLSKLMAKKAGSPKAQKKSVKKSTASKPTSKK